MDSKILFIGLDVDDKNFHGYVMGSGLPEGFDFKAKPTVASVLCKVQKFIDEGYELKFCYESTYLGFSLCREFTEKGYSCDVIAASLIPERAGDRVKTDRIDAKKLATYFMKGLLTSVRVPSLDDEMDRALLRTREFVRGQINDNKRFIIQLCRKLGWNYKIVSERKVNHYWTDDHRGWLTKKLNEASVGVRFNLELLIANLDQLMQRLADYDKAISDLASSDKYKTKVQALTCYRGIDILLGLRIITEIGDIKRFPHPKNLMSYAGMDITEYSSGGKERRFKITKMGNKFLRTAVIEANQRFHPPQISRHLKNRRKNCEQKQIEIADRCMMRLHRKYTTMFYRGKPTNKIKVACGREMLGFIWESLMVV